MAEFDTTSSTSSTSSSDLDDDDSSTDSSSSSSTRSTRTSPKLRKPNSRGADSDPVSGSPDRNRRTSGDSGGSDGSSSDATRGANEPKREAPKETGRSPKKTQTRSDEPSSQENRQARDTQGDVKAPSAEDRQEVQEFEQQARSQQTGTQQRDDIVTPGPTGRREVSEFEREARSDPVRQDPPPETQQPDGRVMAGLGIEEDPEGNLSAPDSPDRQPRAERQHEAEVNRAVEGLGIEEDPEGNLHGPDSPDRRTRAERKAGEAQTRAFEGLGIEEDPEGNLSAPDSEDRLSRVEQRQIDEEKERIAEEVSEERGQDYTADDIETRRTEDGTVQFAVDEKETFDYDWSFGLGDPEKDEVEQTIDSAAESYSRKASGASSRLFDEGGVASRSLGGEILEAAGRDETAEWYDTGIRNFGRGAYTGAAQMGNLPGVASGAMEGVEVGAAAVDEAVTKEDQQFLSKSWDRGSAMGKQAYKTATENTASTGGLLVGSLVASYGAMSTAARVSSRAGTATRWAIQPGEELAGTAGHKATRAVAGQRAADRAFPNKEPLIFSEEAAIRAGRGAAQKLRGSDSGMSGSGAKGTATGTGPASRVAREAKALEFRVAEATKSDAPTRGTSDGMASRTKTRMRQEAVSARFKAAETKQRAREKASEKASKVRDNVSEFDSDTRGQAQVPRSKARSEMDTESSPLANSDQVTSSEVDTSEITGPSTSRSRLSRDMQSEVQSPSIDRSRITSSEVEANRSRARRVETNTGAAESPVSRMRKAQKTSVDVRSSVLEGRTEMTSPLDIDTRSRGDVRSELKSEMRAETRTNTDLETGLETEFRTGTDQRTDLETETELELELETELETEQRREVEGRGIRDERKGDENPFGGRDTWSKTLERDLKNPFTGR